MKRSDWATMSEKNGMKMSVYGFNQVAEFESTDKRKAIVLRQPELTLINTGSMGAYDQPS